jgi:Xaa-Pro dipeptidase
MIKIEEYKERRSKLSSLLKPNDLDAFLISESESIYYFTGATYKAQERPFLIVIWPNRKPTFIVPKLEENHMRKAKIGDVRTYWEYPAQIGNGWADILKDVLQNVSILGVEPGISIENSGKIQDRELKPLNLVEKLRLIKSPAEIEMIRQAAIYSDLGMKIMMDKAYYGISILEMFSLGRKVQMQVIKTKIFDPLNCEFLTATWPAPWSSMPHGIPPIDGKLKKGPLVAMSYLRVNGYAAETERTFFLSDPTEEEKKIFNHMCEARQKAFEVIKPGVKCSEVDCTVQNFLKEKGYGDYLLHRTGHGIGQGNHEGPWIAEGSDHILEENMIISIEPGIYIPDIGGFRHSDTVLVTKDGYELLTKFNRDLEDLTIIKPKRIKRLMGKFVQKALKI